MRILPSCSCVSTTVWKHHLNSNEKHEEKAWWKLLQECYQHFWTDPGTSTPQNSSCTDTLPPISQTIQGRWTWHTGHCWRSKDQLTRWMHQSWLTSMDLETSALHKNIRCSTEDQLGSDEILKQNSETESKESLCYDMTMIHKYIYI